VESVDLLTESVELLLKRSLKKSLVDLAHGNLQIHLNKFNDWTGTDTLSGLPLSQKSLHRECVGKRVNIPERDLSRVLVGKLYRVPVGKLYKVLVGRVFFR